MQYNDYELVYMVKEDEEVFSCLLSKYEPLFINLCASFLKKYKSNDIDFEDLMQSCRITLCNVIDRYNPDREVLFYSFLLACLKNSIYTGVRPNVGKPKHYSLDDENLSNSFYCVSDSNPEKEVEDRFFELEIIDFKSKLPFLDSAVFELRYNGFSYREISDLLEINTKKVDNVLVKVRKKLEKYFLFSNGVL